MHQAMFSNEESNLTGTGVIFSVNCNYTKIYTLAELDCIHMTEMQSGTDETTY